MAGRLSLLVLAVAAVAIATGTGAHASCAVLGQPPSVADQIRAAKVAFVGSVIYTTDNDRTARVRVESIWKGPRLPAYVDVHGEAPGSGTFSASEADHQYQTGRRYLFLPLNTQPPFQDYGECSFSTQAYTVAVASYAPAGATAPEPPNIGDLVGNFVGQYSRPLLILVVLVLGAAMVAFLRRPRRTSGPV